MLYNEHLLQLTSLLHVICQRSVLGLAADNEIRGVGAVMTNQMCFLVMPGRPSEDLRWLPRCDQKAYPVCQLPLPPFHYPWNLEIDKEGPLYSNQFKLSFMFE